MGVPECVLGRYGKLIKLIGLARVEIIAEWAFRSSEA